MSNLPPMPEAMGYVPFAGEFYQADRLDQEVKDDPETVWCFSMRQLRAYAEEAVRLERERWEKVALRMVNGRLVGPTLCDVPPEVLAATSRKLMEDPEYRAKMLDLSARSQEGQG